MAELVGKTRTATCYLQVEGKPPGHSSWDNGTEARVRRMTQDSPDTVLPGCIVVKIRVRIPAKAWEPFSPSAVIDVPEELVQHIVQVEAVDANE